MVITMDNSKDVRVISDGTTSGTRVMLGDVAIPGVTQLTIKPMSSKDDCLVEVNLTYLKLA